MGWCATHRVSDRNTPFLLAKPCCRQPLSPLPTRFRRLIAARRPPIHCPTPPAPMSARRRPAAITGGVRCRLRSLAPEPSVSETLPSRGASVRLTPPTPPLGPRHHGPFAAPSGTAVPTACGRHRTCCVRSFERMILDAQKRMVPTSELHRAITHPLFFH